MKADIALLISFISLASTLYIGFRGLRLADSQKKNTLLTELVKLQLMFSTIEDEFNSSIGLEEKLLNSLTDDEVKEKVHEYIDRLTSMRDKASSSIEMLQQYYDSLYSKNHPNPIYLEEISHHVASLILRIDDLKDWLLKFKDDQKFLLSDLERTEGLDKDP